MQQVSIHEAKTYLSEWIEKAVNGESIAKSGKPLLTVSAYARPSYLTTRVGFLKGLFTVPDDFDAIGKKFSLCVTSQYEAAARYAYAALGGHRNFAKEGGGITG